MKKYLLILSSLLMILVIFSSCSGKDEDLLASKYDTLNNLEGISMTINETTISPKGLTVIFENNSDKDFTYGDFFVLEAKIDGKWYEVADLLGGEYGFNDIGYELPPHTSNEWEVDWEWLYGNLDQGTYRIIKDILDTREPGDYDKYFLAAEFTIDE